MVRQAPDDAGLMEEDRLDCEPRACCRSRWRPIAAAPGSTRLSTRSASAADRSRRRRAPRCAAGRLRDGQRPVGARRDACAAPGRAGSAPQWTSPRSKSLAMPPRGPRRRSASRRLESRGRSARARTLQAAGRDRSGGSAGGGGPAQARPGSCSGTCWSLLRMLKAWPAGFSPVTYARHPDLRLRREAYKLLLEFPEHRASALIHGLGDERSRDRHARPAGRLDSCPPESVKPHRAVPGRLAPAGRASGDRRARPRPGQRARTHWPSCSTSRVTRRLFRGWRIERQVARGARRRVSVLARNWGAHPQASACSGRRATTTTQRSASPPRRGSHERSGPLPHLPVATPSPRSACTARPTRPRAARLSRLQRARGPAGGPAGPDLHVHAGGGAVRPRPAAGAGTLGVERTVRAGRDRAARDQRRGERAALRALPRPRGRRARAPRRRALGPVAGRSRGDPVRPGPPRRHRTRASADRAVAGRDAGLFASGGARGGQLGPPGGGRREEHPAARGLRRGPVALARDARRPGDGACRCCSSRSSTSTPRRTRSTSRCSPWRSASSSAWRPTAVRGFGLAGLLHDLGKVRIPQGDPLQAGQAHTRGASRGRGPSRPTAPG